MSELLIELPDDQLPFLMDLLERLRFVQIKQVNGQKLSKEQFLNDLEVSLKQAKRHLAGEIRLKNIKAVLDEI